MSPENPSFAPLLTDEIKRLTEVLPRALTGAAPVSPLLFQPTEEGGRLVYLDANVAANDPIWLNPGPVSEKFFFDLAGSAPWSIAEGKIAQGDIEQYCKRNDQPMRSRLALQDRKRHPDITYSDDGAPKAGTPYRMHHIFPSPLFHRNVDWWKRLPRFGQIYSFGDRLEHPNLLLICAVAIGNRALHIRLKVLLEHNLVFTFRESGHEKTAKTAYSIAALVSAGTQVDDDEFLFLIAHLTLCHHWFFPFDPVALQIFAKLGAVADDVLQRHGWPASGWERHLETKRQVSDLIGDLAKDLLFLIYACTRWGTPESPKADSDTLLEGLKKKLPDALALICGNVEYVTLSASTLRFQPDPPQDRGYIFIRAPEQLQVGGGNDPLLPLFSLDQLSKSNQASTANAYIRTLCPVQLEGQDHAWNTMRVMRVRGDRVVDKDKNMGKWLTGYARARCMLKILGLLPATVASTAASAALGRTPR